MPKKKVTKVNVKEDISKDRIKELEKQVRTLEIKNAFLKELRKLRKQEEKQRMKLSRPLSSASEKNSN